MRLINGLFSRARFLINFLSIFSQGVIVAAFWGMVASRSDFEEISITIFPDSQYLMDSFLIDVFLSPLASGGLLLVFLVNLVKEFVVKNKPQKLLMNVIVLLGFTTILGLMAYGLYSPVA